MNTSQQVAEKTNELTTVITQELNRLVQKAQTTTEEIRDLNLRLGQLQSVYNDMQKVTVEAETLIVVNELATDATAAFASNLRQRVEATLAEAQQARQEVQTRIANELGMMKQTHVHLQALLEQLRGKHE